MGDYGHDLEFGVFIEPAARSADQVVALSVLAEDAGYDLVSYNDHPYSPRSLVASIASQATGEPRGAPALAAIAHEHIASRLPDADLGKLTKMLRTIADTSPASAEERQHVPAARPDPAAH